LNTLLEVFYIPTNNFTNSFPIILPASPGPGLKWSLSDFYYAGNVKVVSATDPAYSIYLTNNITKLNGTNYINLSWPDANKGGWVESLTTGLTNGLTATNWAYVTSTTTNTSISLTNTATGPGAVFYRFVYP